MRFLIYGAGDQGQALGCMLAADGHPVDLVLRQRFLSVISKQGLRITGLFGDFQADGDTFGLMTGISAADGSDYDYILVTTKSYGTVTAIADIADQFKKLFYEVLIPATFDHRPSMLQDLENNKPTEVEALVGYVSVTGQKHGVVTPCCSQLASLIRYRQ